MPSARYISIETLSRRFESFLPWAFTSIGKWAHTGSATPRARRIRICFSTFDRWSSPRMTWVMPSSMSSTALASTNSGEPFARRSTKSSTVATSISLVP
jgi:hypothetical protein